MSKILIALLPDEGWGHYLFILLLSMVASSVIIVQYAPESWFELIKHFYYYKSLLLSMLIASLLTTYIYKITARLNRKHLGFKLNGQRIKIQIIYGFLGGVLLELIMASILYLMNNKTPLGGTFFSRLFPLISLYILAVNLCYSVYYLYLEELKPAPEMPVQFKTIVKYKSFGVKPMDLENLPAQNPALIHVENKGVFAYNFGNGKHAWPLCLAESISLLPREEYFQIDKQTIVHWALIKEVQSKSGDRLVIIPITKLPFEICTSRRRTAEFKEWMARRYEDRLKTAEVGI